MAKLDPIIGRYVTLSQGGKDFRIYFEENGSGIPLLCLHTAGAHSSQFRHLMCDPEITKNFRIIAFDLPWHGKSTPPVGWQEEEYKLTSTFYIDIIKNFIGSLNLKKPLVMGCSMGGRVVIRLAYELGKELSGVIGLEGSDQPAPWYDNSWTSHPNFENGDFCVGLVSGLCAPQSPDEYKWETLWHYYQSGHGVFKGDMHFFRTDSDYADNSATIDTELCPVYLMTGEYDYSCTPEATVETASRIPGAEAVIMREVGHFPMSENPDVFRNYLIPVLDNFKEGEKNEPSSS